MKKQEQKPTLEDRVTAFNCFELPGQPMYAHMGTNYLVRDLAKEVTVLTKERDALMAAGKIALEACVGFSRAPMTQVEYLSLLRVIAALKAAGVS